MAGGVGVGVGLGVAAALGGGVVLTAGLGVVVGARVGVAAARGVEVAMTAAAGPGLDDLPFSPPRTSTNAKEAPAERTSRAMAIMVARVSVRRGDWALLAISAPRR